VAPGHAARSQPLARQQQRRHEPSKRVQRCDDQPEHERRLVKRQGVEAEAHEGAQRSAVVRAHGNECKAGAENGERRQHHQRSEQAQQQWRRTGLPIADIAEVVAQHPPSGRRGLGQRERHEQRSDEDVHRQQAVQRQQRRALDDKGDQQQHA